MSTYLSSLKRIYDIPEALLETLDAAHERVKPIFEAIEKSVEFNHLKVLTAFQANNVSDFHLNGSTGYGYGDSGRDTLEAVYATLFKAEKALVRSQIVSGTHALAIGLLGNLRSGEELISATGTPYDTLQKIIGFHDEAGSLKSMNVAYREIALKNNKIDLNTLLETISAKTKMIYFQRSSGYEWRTSLTIAQLEKAIQAIKKGHPHILCMVDNCYGEFVEEQEPIEIGADLVAGSLIKNPGGGLALTGGYLVGRATCIEQAAIRLSAPGLGLSMGSSLNFNRPAYQGLFMAPLIVGETVKGAILAARFYESLGYKVLPGYLEARTDIIQAIEVGSPEAMVAFCAGIQKASALDSFARPEPALLPGYNDEVIMAGGTFIQGSSIELSADGPIRPPYIVYLQGGLSLAHIKTGLALSASEMMK